VQLTNGFIGVGSDTIQDVNDAFTGLSNNVQYTPLLSQGFVLDSWRAIGSGCITPKAPGASFERPNGSGKGQGALARAIDGGNWGSTTDGVCNLPGRSVSGLIDYARSSGGPGTFTNQANAETFIPFARDGVSYAYATRGTATAITDLTKAELTTIYSSAGNGTTIRGTFIIPCGIQTGSGTKNFWQGIVGDDSTSTTLCNSVAPQLTGLSGRIEENNGSELQAKATSLAAQATPPNGGNFQVIVGHSAASFIAQNNGAAPSALGSPAVGLGAISNDGNGNNLGSPYSGTAPNLAPSSTFFNNTTFGRFVYHVFDSARVQPGTLGNAPLKNMFVGTSSVVCSASAQATVNKYGFLSLTGAAPNSCGDTSRQQDLPTTSQ
jgi:phosphate transport system substrate-binding protein